MSPSGLKPRWGDINGFFGLLVDNGAALVLLYTLLAAPGFRVDRFSPQFVLAWMIPGTAAGVLMSRFCYDEPKGGSHVYQRTAAKRAH
jgi:hypothetical protein